ncbi:MAG: sensor domain-containing diguanylate cyclase [Planctomycetaceae bacterium]|nr:sensor domain-containing diguanylate cyclase [Planctomycetaceae bacterium]
MIFSTPEWRQGEVLWAVCLRLDELMSRSPPEKLGPMIRALLNTKPWRLVVLIGTLAPLAIVCGIRWEGTGGAVSLASLILPVTLVALSGRLRWTLAASCLVSISIAIEAAYSGGPDDGNGLRFAAALVLIITALGALVSTTVRFLRNSIEDPRTSLRYLRELEQLPVPVRTETAMPPESVVSAEFPVLLHTLEDIGRRISMNLDLETLLPAIVSTAKASLRCGECRVFLWDQQGSELVNPLGRVHDEQADVDCFSPSVESGLGAWVIRERTLLTSERVEQDHLLKSELSDDDYVPQAIAPLMAGGDLLGLIVIDELEHQSSNFERMLDTLTNIYALGLKNAQLFRRVEEMALRDGLTGLFNHTTFQRELRSLVRKSTVNGTPLSLVMSDVDRFKSFNDDYGHQAGDDVLRELALLWKAVMPNSAILARYGGEEFIAALPNCDEDRATELAEILRSTIEEHPFLSHGREMRVTASFGVAEFAGGSQSTDDLVRVSDQCLYTAKKSGRNNVVRYTERSVISLRSTS